MRNTCMFVCVYACFMSPVHQLMLERFQRENPGFDFSGAEFNGAAPDPSKFMGGLKNN